MKNELSILIPVYNSSQCLKQTVENVIASVDAMHVPYEIFLIDDGSIDGSWNLIKELKSLYTQVKGVRFSKNFGQHNALLCGVNLASAAYIVTIDDDMEQDPADIKKLYDKIKRDNADLIYGVPNFVKKNIFRKTFTAIYKKISRVENKNAGIGSSFRIFNESLRQKLVLHSGSLFFLDEIVLWYTNNIGYEAVNFNASLKSKSGYTSGSLFSLSLRVLSISSTMPLKIVRTVGFYIFMISILLAGYYIVRKFVYNVPMGFTTIMVAVLFSTGIITFSLGIIGEYLGNLISLHNNKPSYSIKEII